LTPGGHEIGDPGAVGVSIGPAALDSPDARELVEELDEYLNALYPPEENFLALDGSEVGDGRGLFLVARDGDAAVGCGAVRRLSDTTGEIKRMYVRRQARGLGIGRRVLDELHSWAASAGLTRLVLETGTRQPEAIALYETAGYSRIPCFGEYAGAPESICYERLL
jgi:GNAT superfamily N-acetyltransferase